MDYMIATKPIKFGTFRPKRFINPVAVDTALGLGVFQKYRDRIMNNIDISEDDLRYAEESLPRIPEPDREYVTEWIAFYLFLNVRKLYETKSPSFAVTVLRWWDRLLDTDIRLQALGNMAYIYTVYEDFVEAKNKYVELSEEPNLPEDVKQAALDHIEAIGTGEEEFRTAKALCADKNYENAHKWIEAYARVATGLIERAHRSEYRNIRIEVLSARYRETKNEALRTEVLRLIDEGKAERDSQ